MKIVLLPGWHESGDHMRTFVNGKHGHAGFTELGYDCEIFEQGNDPLRPRVERFAAFLDDLKRREPDSFPVTTFGYSAGGLINRGFLRAYPERANEIFATIQIATPNAGLITAYFETFLKLMHVPDEVIADIDVASDFMTWLNGTPGHWIQTGKPSEKVWRLDESPTILPHGARMLHIVGRVPKYHSQSDGVVMLDWATLDDRVPSVFIEDSQANHLNLGAVFNWIAFFARGFRPSDKIWQHVIQLADRYIKQEEGRA